MPTPHRTIVRLAAAGIPVLLWSQAGTASTAQTSFSVTATVQSACVASASTLAFGNYDPVSASSANATSTITVTCTPSTSFTIGLNPGATAGATVSTRQMASGAHRLQYALFSDAGRTTNWGNSPGIDTPSASTGTGSAQNFTVYGQIPAQQVVTPGAYTDTVTVTVNY